MKSFASDNYAGTHTRILEALARANIDYARAYGDDPWTEEAVNHFKRLLGQECEVFFVPQGTGANVVLLKALLRPWEAVVCPETAHINSDESGAPEAVVGCKLMGVETPDGKLRPRDVESCLPLQSNPHRSMPRLVSISQCTELGTVYRPEEIRALSDLAHDNNMFLHMDGARIANAAAFLEQPLIRMTRDAGVDVLSFGGTKNGLIYGEAVVFFRPELAEGFARVRKQGLQLMSKMRFMSVQFSELLRDDLWLNSARHANAMARRLADGLVGCPHVEIIQPVEANAIFAKLKPEHIAALQKNWIFYEVDGDTHVVRWMTTFSTTEEEVDAFAEAIRSL